jgi:hypothetical protein
MRQKREIRSKGLVNPQIAPSSLALVSCGVARERRADRAVPRSEETQLSREEAIRSRACRAGNLWCATPHWLLIRGPDDGNTLGEFLRTTRLRRLIFDGRARALGLKRSSITVPVGFVRDGRVDLVCEVVISAHALLIP